MSQQGRRNGPPLVPIADFPNQAHGKAPEFETSVLRERWFDLGRQRQVRCAHLDLLSPRPYGMRHLHNLDIDLEVDLRCTIMERKSPIDACRSLDQRQKLALAPDRDAARDVTKRPHEAQELDGVAEPVVTADQYILAPQLLAAPDALEVTRPGMLGWIRKRCQIAVADRPGAFELACPHRLGPAAGHVVIQLAPHEFVKAARLTVLGVVLVEEGNAGLVELGEEFVPADPVETVVGRIEIDAQDTGVSVLLRGLDRRGLSAALLCPFPDDVVAGGLLGFAGL